MRFPRIDSLVLTILCSVALSTSSGSVWASSDSCTYKPEAGIGGAGHGGTGIGGTGTIAQGTGIGGTGMTPESKAGRMRLAGRVIASAGNVEAQSNGRSRPLAKNDAVCAGETIITRQSATVQLRMNDHAMIAIAPQTQLRIAKYVYGGTSRDISQLTLLKGTSRFTTGNIGKAHPANDLIQTPDGTIGVRGTDHEATVILPNEGASYPAGTYDRVNSGITFIRTEKGEVEIHASQAGYAASNGELPILLHDIPDFRHINTAEEPKSGAPAEALPSHEHGDMPHHAEPSTEHPEHPELPEHPALPEPPEHPGSVELPEHSDLSGTPTAEIPEHADQ